MATLRSNSESPLVLVDQNKSPIKGAEAPSMGDVPLVYLTPEGVS